MGGGRPSRRPSGGDRSEVLRIVVADRGGDPDSYGDPPGYADIARASVEIDGPKIMFRLKGRGEFPQRMPDEVTDYVAAFSISKGEDDYFISAEADAGGWFGRIAHNQEEIKFRGRVVVADNTVRIVLPLAAIGGRGAFTWWADSSWTRQTSITEYSLDRAPEFDDARSPRRRR